MGKGGYFLSYFLSGAEIQVYDLQPNEEIQTIGSAESCHIRLEHSSDVQPIHAMLRFSENHWQICCVVSCQIDEQVVDADQWTALPFSQYCYLSAKTALLLSKTRGHAKMEMLSSQQLVSIGKAKKTEPEEAPSLLDEMHALPDLPVPEVQAEEVSRYAHFGQQRQSKEDIVKEELTIMDHEEIDKFLKEDEDDEEMASILAKINKAPEKPAIREKESEKPEDFIPTEMLGKIINNRYHIVKKLGAGAMGEVYEANDNQLRRKVALKILSAAQDHVVLQRFANEISAIGKLQHPHIVAIHDVGEYQSRPYFTMDLLVGEDLKKKVESNDVAPRDAMEWIQQIATALQMVHQKKIIHRDIKPSNILITERGAVLTDFGIAKDLSTLSKLTTAGETLGTPAYMSPEQARGISSQINTSSDVYSLGAVLYELLTRRPPFVGAAVDVMQQVCTVDPLPIRQFNRDVHQNAVVITMKAMAKEQRYRYQSAQEMADDIRCYLEGQPLFGRMPPIWARAKYNRGLRRLSFTLLAGILVVVGTLVWVLLQYYQSGKQKQEMIRQYLVQAEEALSKAPQMQFDKVMDSVDVYTRILTLSPGNTRALRGKFEAICVMVEQAQKQGNLEFAEALCHIAMSLTKAREGQSAEDIRLSPAFTQEDVTRIRLATEQIDQLKSKRKQLQLQEAEKVLEDLNTENISPNIIKETALSLLRFPTVLGEIRQKHKRNTTYSQALDLAYQYARKKLSKKTIVETTASVEELMIQLLPYSGTELNGLLCQQLESDTVQIRVFCAQLLGLIRCQEALQPLIKRLRYDNEAAVLRSSLRSLLSIDNGEESFLEAIRIDYSLSEEEMARQIESRRRLIQQLNYGEQFALDLAFKILDQYQSNLTASRNKNFAGYFAKEEPKLLLDVLSKLKKSSITMLLARVKKSSGVEKLLLLKALADYPDERVLSVLLQEIKNPDAETRLASFVGLGNFLARSDAEKDTARHQGIIDLLLSGLVPQESVEIQISAVKSLGKIKYTAATSQLFDCLAQSFQRIDVLDSKEQAAIIRSLQELQKEILQTLRSMGQEIMPILKQRLQNEKGPSKFILLQTLAVLQPEEVIGDLIQYLASPKLEDVQMAIETLRLVGKPAIIPLQQAFNQGNNDMRSAILRIVEDVQQDEVFAIYEKILADDNSPLVQQVLASLYKKGEKGYQLLLKVLFNGEGADLQSAAQSLAKIQPSVLSRMLEIFDNPQAMANQFRKDPMFIFDRTCLVLIAIGRAVLPKVIPLLDHRDANIRIQAVKILGKLGDDKETDLLVNHLFDNTIKDEVKRVIVQDVKSLAIPKILALWNKNNLTAREKEEIIEILGEIGDKRSLPILYDLLDDKVLWKVAAASLRRVGSVTIPELILLLQDENKKRGAKLALKYMEAEAMTPLMDVMLSTSHPYLKEQPSDKSLSIRKEIPGLLATFEVRKRYIVENLVKAAANNALDGEVKNMVWEALPKAGSEVVKHMVAFYDQESATAFHGQVKKVLLSSPAYQIEALPLLMTLWKKMVVSGRHQQVRDILLDIGRKDNSFLARSLTGELRNDNVSVRCEAVYMLRDINAKQAIHALQKKAQTDSDAKVRDAAQNAVSVLQKN